MSRRLTSKNGLSRIRVALLLTAALTFLCAPAAAHFGHGGVEEEEYEASFLLPPGEWAEVDLWMDGGGTIEWDVHTVDGGKVYLDLHSHGIELEHHARYNSTSAESGIFTAPYGGGYSILVENNEDHEVLVQVRIDGTFVLENTVNIEPLGDAAESGAPSVGLLGALGVAAMVLRAIRRR